MRFFKEFNLISNNLKANDKQYKYSIHNINNDSIQILIIPGNSLIYHKMNDSKKNPTPQYLNYNWLVNSVFAATLKLVKAITPDETHNTPDTDCNGS